jgi:CBS domain-containing protein
VKTVIPSIVTVMTPFPHSIAAEETLAAARRMMEHHGIGHLPVTQDGRLVGVLLEQQLRPSHRADDEEPVEEVLDVGKVCSLSPYVVQVSDQLDNVVMEMARRRASCVLVLRNEKLAGILTTSDVCRLFAERLRAVSAPDGDDQPA